MSLDKTFGSSQANKQSKYILRTLHCDHRDESGVNSLQANGWGIGHTDSMDIKCLLFLSRVARLSLRESGYALFSTFALQTINQLTILVGAVHSLHNDSTLAS